MKETLKIELNSKSDKEKIENFLKKENLIYEWEISKQKLSREELIKKLRNPELEGKAKVLGDIVNFSTEDEWEALKD